jgi:hypothetical protein
VDEYSLIESHCTFQPSCLEKFYPTNLTQTQTLGHCTILATHYSVSRYTVRGSLLYRKAYKLSNYCFILLLLHLFFNRMFSKRALNRIFSRTEKKGK